LIWCSQIYRVDLRVPVGQAPPDSMDAIDQALRNILDL